MSNQQPNRPTSGPQRPSGGQGSSGGGAVAFDPLKLLQKYKFVLAGAIIAGMFIGVGAHILALRFMPGFKSTVWFECAPAESDVQTINVAKIDEDEMARFMGTQVQTIKGELVIAAVLQDARIEAEAPKWYNQFSRKGNLDVVEAYEELEDTIKAYAIPNTYIIQLSVQVGDKNDAAGLVRLVKENYIRILSSGTNSNITRRKETIRKAITGAEDTLLELTNRKNRLVEEKGIDTADSDQSAQAESLRLVNAQIINNQQQIEAFQVILANDESQLQRKSGIDYDSTLRDRVEQMPLVQAIQQQINTLTTQMLALQTEGFLPEHRTYKQMLSQLEATERNLETTREKLLLESFETRIDSTRMALSQLQAQIADLTSTQETLLVELNDFTKTTEEIEEINRQISNTLDLIAAHDINLADLSMAAGLDSASRISVIKPENVPDRPAFPILYIMVPAGMFLVTALTAGVILIFEMLDQRVKSAADIAMIPRTRILGIVPDAEEDPTSHKALETLFMDSPSSVLAEHFRQLRTRIHKDMSKHDHTTLLVASAMPGSGATTVATNLAQASQAAGKKTLIIDTNFRRARIHTAFGLLDNPGLGELLAGEKSFEEAVQKTTSGGPDVLAAGSRNLRVVERLGTSVMGEILAQASAKYDIVIIDVSPAIVSGDVMTLASQADACMLVVRAMSEKRGQVARLKNELSDNRAEFLGVLVNGVHSAAGGYMRKNIRTSHQYHAGDTDHAA
ncbi:MAG: polysaccharide biosynthesis tyrosine autokinase [Phycisphaerales bacterium]|nr:polysaccharide biosynthesis tyrosine autokinase [Phycisphaerales bacterium]